MARFLLFAFLFQIFTGTFGRNSADTLELQLSGLRQEEQLDMLIKLAKNTTKSKPRETIHYAIKAWKLAIQLNDQEKTAEAAFLLSDGYLFVNRVDSAMFYATKSLDIYRKTDKPEDILKAANQVGLVFLQKDDFSQAELTFLRTFNDCNHYLVSGKSANNVKEITASVFTNLVATYIKQGNYAKAKEKLLQFCSKRDYGNTFTGMIIVGNLATVYQMLAKYDSALFYSNKALGIANLLQEPLYVGTAYSDIGNTYYFMGSHSRAISNYQEAVRIFISLNDKQRLARTYNNLASVYKQISSFEKATAYFMKSAKLKEELADSTGLAATYNNLGLVYADWENPKMAEKYLRMSMSINKLRKNKKALAVNFTGLGDLFLTLQNADSALFYFEKSLSLKTEIGHKYGIVNSLHGIGNVYSRLLHDDQAAIDYYQKALLLADDIGSGFEIASLNLSLGEIYYKMKKFKVAGDMFEKTLGYAEKENSLDQIQKSCQYLTEINIISGNKPAAMEFFIRYRSAGDSLFSKEKTKAVLEMQTRFETERKEHENLMLSQINNYQKIQIRYLIGIAAVLLSLGIIILYLLRQKSKAYRQIVRKNMEILHDEKRMEARKLLNQDTTDLSLKNQPYQNFPNTSLGLLVKLTKMMDEEKPYLETGVTIEDLCRKLSTNRTYLSQLINENFHQNFNSFINGFRIKEARRLLADPKNDHISIEGIGSLSGFTSKVTFHSTFKQQVGVTPSYFRRSATRMMTPVS